MPRRVSSGRSPAVPMIAVTGAARPGTPPAIAAATSRMAPVPASLWAKSTMTVRRPSRNTFSRPGESSADGRKSRRPAVTCSRVAPSALAPPAAASALATLCLASPPRATGRSATSRSTCVSAPSHSTSRPSSSTQALPPVRRWRRRTGADPGSSEKYATGAWTRRATAATRGSSALRTTSPSGPVTRQTVALTSASSGRVWMPWRSRWSDETFVKTLASLDS